MSFLQEVLNLEVIDRDEEVCGFITAADSFR